MIERLSAGNQLVHASLKGGLQKLEPGEGGVLFATENISFSILCALLKLQTARSPIVMQSYSIMGKHFHVCSVDRDFRELMDITRLYFYFCKRDGFQKSQKIDSRLSRMTLQLIRNIGHEWTSSRAVVPVFTCDMRIAELIQHSDHPHHECRPRILLRYLWQKRRIPKDNAL